VLTRIDYWPIGGTTTLFARCHSRDGAGAATGVLSEDGKPEGKYITAAQVSTIVCKVYDRSGSTPDTSLGTVSITSAAIVSAVTPTSGDGTGRDVSLGPYNLLFDLATAYIATAGKIYRVTIDITLTTGTVLATMAWEGEAKDLSP
jgi:hypothetical protein